MFIQNKYTKWYYNIINNAKSKNRIKSKEEYFENHHIIPKSLGGSLKKTNCVLLTGREHFIIHCLLIKMVDNVYDKRKMSLAFYKMKQCNSSGNNRIGNGKLYEVIRKSVAHLNSGDNNYFHHHRYFGEENVMSNPIVRQKHLQTMQSPEFRNKMSEKMTGENNPFYGKSHSKEFKEWMSNQKKELYKDKTKHPMYGKKPKQIKCENCGKITSVGMNRRWHGKNCKKYKEN